MADPYNTNLAAEFYVLSMLHRRGADAFLTLGNKKAVDLVVTRGAGRPVTIDVKGVAGRWDWPADNVRLRERTRHFLVLVSFEGQIRDPKAAPSVWVIPARNVATFIRKYKTRTVISRAAVKERGARFRDAWHWLAR
jgi:hypothetical protein